ncbi:MAG TPA: ABC transporter permease, partial [Actinomycetota bacterium]|nr:ABC transporter permease [Actinomycetota bacterium]
GTGRAFASPAAAAALRVSLVTTGPATALSVVLGLPLAWVQARSTARGITLLRAVTTLPIVLPPVVGGVALLAAFGRRGLLGQWLERTAGISIPFTTTAAVLAATFVSMPFLVLTVEGAMRSMDERAEDAARTLGARPWTVFRRITLPAVGPAALAGAVLAGARALGEFGATVTFAGSFPGRTQTLPLAVHSLLETDLDAAISLSVLLVALSLAVLVALRGMWLRSG